MTILVFNRSTSGVQVRNIRVFSDEQEKKARKYYESLIHSPRWHQVYGYQTSDNVEPELIWSLAKDNSAKKKAGKE